jgi:hypothetical protein
VNGTIRLFLTLLVVLALTALVGIHAQANDTPQWITGKPGDFKDSMVYQALGDFGGRHYVSTIYGRDLDGVVKWKPGEELPTSMSKILTNAQNAFRKQFPQFSQFKIISVNLVHLPAVDDWVFDVEFNGTDFATVKEGSFEDKKLNVLVLLSGRVFTPTETAK